MKENYTKLVILLVGIIVLVPAEIKPQNPNWFSLPEFWKVIGEGMANNIEAEDVNKDGHPDIVIGNWNDTYVYYGGAGILDKTIDVIYTGRMLALCDYNGDGIKDLITMHFTSYDSTRQDYDGEILFYYGSDTTSLLIDTTPEYSIPLPTLYPAGEMFGEGYVKSGCECKDLNNDYKNDLIISSYRYGIAEGKFEAGNIYIYMGKEIPSDVLDFSVAGISSDSQFGKYFDVGDINGDGYNDLLISSRIRSKSGDWHHPDSLAILHVYYGQSNFIFYENNESIKYISHYYTVEGSLPDTPWSDWFRPDFSVDDINSDGMDDVIVGGINSPPCNRDSIKIYYSTTEGIDTNLAFVFTNPDTTDDDYFACSGISHNIGDFNGDEYNDFVFSHYRIFSLQLGGPYASSKNPYGIRGLLESRAPFPTKAINIGDQNGDAVKDFAVIDRYSGTAMIISGNHLIHTDVKDVDEDIIKGFHLYQNYPNPFNPTTVIGYRLSVTGNVILKIYDALGKEITRLIDKEQSAGEYKIEFDSRKYDLSSGAYYYELKINYHHSVKKMMVIK